MEPVVESEITNSPMEQDQSTAQKIIGKISAETFKRLQEQNVLTIKSSNGDEQKGGVIKVKSNCPIKFVNSGGVLQVQHVERYSAQAGTSCDSDLKEKTLCQKPSTSGRASPVILAARVNKPKQIFREKKPKYVKKTKPVKARCKKKTPDPTFIRVSQHVRQFYPELQIRKLIWGDYNQSTAMEVTRKGADLGVVSPVPVTAARVVFYPTSWKVELKVLGVLDALISTSVGRLGDIDFSELDEVLAKLGPKYHFCAGISVSELEEQCIPGFLEKVPKYLVVGNDGYRAAVCQHWFDCDLSDGLGPEGVQDAVILKCAPCISALETAITHNEDATCNDDDGKDELEDICPEKLSEEELRVHCEALQKEARLVSCKIRRLETKIPQDMEITAKISEDMKTTGATKGGAVRKNVPKRLIKHYEAVDNVLKMIDVGVEFSGQEEAIQTLRIKDTLIKSRLKTEIRCSLCSRDFENPLLFVKHKLNHKRDYKCSICNKPFFTKHTQKAHEAIHDTERPFKCICGNSFRTNKDLVLHQRSHSTDQPFKCGQCSKAFKRQNHLKHHMISHGEKGDFVCKYCNKNFGVKNSLDTHVLIHTGKKPFPCKHCDERFRQTGHLKMHLARKHPEDPDGRMYYRCERCPKSFTLESQRNKHQAEHDPAEKNLSCRVCEEKFHNRGSLQAHEAGHGIIKAPRANSIDYSANGRICETCGKIFSSISSLKVHERIHSGARPYKCEICEKTFIQEGYLKIHRRYHTGHRPYKCKTCHKQFAQICTLKMHEFQHQEVRPYVCEVCGKSYSVPNALRTHMRLHTDEKPFACSYCPKRFRQLGHLTSHENTHTRARVFTCDQCGKEFLQKTDMIKHRRIHTGEKPFRCKECGRGFAQQSSLKSHLRTHDAIGRFECEVCCKRFRHKVTLRNHLQTFHAL